MSVNFTNLDSSQVLRASFSDADQALRTIPSNLTAFTIVLSATEGDSVQVQGMSESATALNAVAGDTPVNSTAQDISHYSGYSIQAVWSAFATASDPIAATITIELSNDGTHWDPTASTITISSAAGNKVLPVLTSYTKYFRVAYTTTVVNAGTLTVNYMAKG